MRKKKTLRKGGISRALVVPPIAAGEGGLRAGAKAGDALALMATPADQGAASLAVYYNHNYIYIYNTHIHIYLVGGRTASKRGAEKISSLCCCCKNLSLGTYRGDYSHTSFSSRHTL